MIQTLLVTPERFAEISCMDGRAFGVVTACERCDYSLNPCMREHLQTALAQNQERAERLLGYTLTERYHEEELMWDGRSRIQLSRAGVAAINVKQKVVSLGTFEVSPYMLEGLTSTDVSGLCILELDGDLIDNPSKAVIRDAVSGSVIQTQKVSGYPKKNVSGNWLVALEGDTPPCDTTLNVSHCSYIALTTETPICDGKVMVVFPGTEQVIPFAKQPTVSGSDTTYWFYAWSLVDPAFRDEEEINLLNGEFYKLITEVELVCVKDTYAPPVVTEEDCNCLCCKTGKAGSTAPAASTSAGNVSLSVMITTPTTEPQPNDKITALITVSNGGQAAAHAVELTMSIGSGYETASYSTTQGDYDDPIWDVGTILPDQSATLALAIVVNAQGDYELIGEITNVTETDENSADDSAELDIEPEEYGVEASLLLGKLGVVNLCVSDDWRWSCKKPIKIKLFYKTSPEALGVQTGAIEEGITYLTAAELPTASCDCPVNEKSFVAEAQKPYTDIRINPVTGVTYAPLKYGNLHGQLVFGERIEKAHKQRKIVQL